MHGKFPVKSVLMLIDSVHLDQESTGFVSNERGYDEDYVQTALHITCTLKSHIDAFQILYCLLSSGANPNRFEIKYVAYCILPYLVTNESLLPQGWKLEIVLT